MNKTKFSKKFKKAIIHIGLHKTGTTSIQNAFYNNRKDLEKHCHILYPGIHSNHGIPLVSMLSENPGRYHVNIKNKVTTHNKINLLNKMFLYKLKREFVKTKAAILLISGEGLSLLPFEGVNKLKGLLSLYTDSFEIIVWLREPYSCSSSLAQEQIRAGGKTLDHVNTNPMPPRYKNRVTNYIKAFGLSSIQVVDYNEAILHPGGIIGRFCDFVDIKQEYIDKLISYPRKNDSMTSEAAVLISKINEIYPLIVDGKMGRFRQKNDIKALTLISGKKFKLNESAMKKVERIVQEDLEWLEDTFNFRFKSSGARFVQDLDYKHFSDEAIDSIALKCFEHIRESRKRSILKMLLSNLFKHI